MFALTPTATATARLVFLVCAAAVSVTSAYPGDPYAPLRAYLREPKYYTASGQPAYLNSARMKLQNDDFDIDDDFSNDMSGGGSSSPTLNGVLVSQNRKYLAKSPEHDAHFRAILRQQEDATIKDPGQAAQVASDQAELRGRLRHSLQTSDDDVYEVESAPVMKSTPYYRSASTGSGRRYRKQREQPMPYRDEPQDQEGEERPTSEVDVPMNVNFESNIDHSYEPQQQHQPKSQKRYRPVGYSNQMPMKFVEDGEPNEDDYDDGSYKPRTNPIAENPHFSVGLIDDDNNAVPPPRSPSRPRQSSSYKRGRGQGRAKVNAYHHQPSQYQQIQYTHVPSDSYVPEKSPSPPRYFAASETEYRGPGSYQGQRPAAGSSSQYMHRDLYASQPKYGSSSSSGSSKPHPMESSWLDMGAYSSGKGAFGWYSDVPVGGSASQTESKKK